MKITRKLQFFLTLAIASALISAEDSTPQKYQKYRQGQKQRICPPPARIQNLGWKEDNIDKAAVSPADFGDAIRKNGDMQPVDFRDEPQRNDPIATADLRREPQKNDAVGPADFKNDLQDNKDIPPADIKTASQSQKNPAAQSGSLETSEVRSEDDPIYIGNRLSRVFHLPECFSAVRTGSKNRVTFSTPQQALSEGFTPCKNCRPQDL